MQAFDNRQLEDRIENTSLLSLYTCPAQQLSLFSFYISPMVFLNLVPRGLVSLYFQDLWSAHFCAVSSQTIWRWNATASAHPLKSPLHPPCMEISTLFVNFMGIYGDKFSFTWGHLKSFNSFISLFDVGKDHLRSDEATRTEMWARFAT